MKSAIANVYGKERTEEIYNKIIEIVNKSIQSRPKELVQQDKTRPDDWYKREIIYMFYVDQFGTVRSNQENTFRETALMFDYLEDLGVTTLLGWFVLASLAINEIRSILENLVEAGFNVPNVLINGLEVADKIINKENENDGVE